MRAHGSERSARSWASRRLAAARVVVREFRNVEHAELTLGDRLTVLSGPNGSGKTTLLEAIYFVATSRSFRTRKPSELVRHGQDVASVRAAFTERDNLRDPAGAGEAAGAPPPRPWLTREQSAAIRAVGGAAALRVDGARPRSLAEYASHSPVVVFHPDDLALSSGPAQLRRTLLDRVALHAAPASLEARARYGQAVRARQRLLERHRGQGSTDLGVFEEIAAEQGAVVTRARRSAASLLVAEIEVAFGAIAAPDLVLGVRYAPGGSEDPAEALEHLRRDRARDLHRASASFGPHRDDLELSLGGHPARTVASQGQHRALTLGLKVAELASIARAKDLEPILLLDDVSSELDPARTAALFTFLAGAPGQVVLTTTRPELIASTLGPSERRDYEIAGGAVREGRSPPG